MGLVVGSLVLLAAARDAAALGTRVLVFDRGSSITLGYGALSQELLDAGAAGVDQQWPATFDDYRLVFLLDIGGMSQTELGQLVDFVAAGGGVVLVSEPVGNGVAPLNDVATALGVNARLVDAQTLDGCNEIDVAAAAASSPLTTGAPTLSVSRSSVTQGGAVLYSAGGGVDPITFDGRVVLAGDVNMFADGGCLGCCDPSLSSHQFWRNLYASLPMDPGGGGGGGGADMSMGGGGGGNPDSGAGGCAYAGHGPRAGGLLACALSAAFLFSRRRRPASARRARA
jgi:hypothetical protein